MSKEGSEKEVCLKVAKATAKLESDPRSLDFPSFLPHILHKLSAVNSTPLLSFLSPRGPATHQGKGSLHFKSLLPILREDRPWKNESAFTRSHSFFMQILGV